VLHCTQLVELLASQSEQTNTQTTAADTVHAQDDHEDRTSQVDRHSLVAPVLIRPAATSTSEYSTSKITPVML